MIELRKKVIQQKLKLPDKEKTGGIGNQVKFEQLNKMLIK